MAMFQQPARPNGSVHVEFRAGRMDWDGRMVTADKRKGKIILMTSEEEQLMHFQWMDREKSEVAVDLIVINDAYLEKIEKCTTGRVYLLRFTSSERKLFFWMQEPKTEKDAELISKFNEAIGAKIPEKGAPKPAGAAAPAPAAGLPAAGNAPIDPAIRAMVQQFIAQQGPRTPPVPLSAMLTTEVLQSLMADEAAVAEMSTLLPPGQQTSEDCRDALGSPQLQQSLTGLTQAVHSDQLPVLFASLGLDPSSIASAAPGTDALELLVRAMEGPSSGSSPAPGSGGDAPAPGGGAPPA
jgi:hypothetical protein